MDNETKKKEKKLFKIQSIYLQFYIAKEFNFKHKLRFLNRKFLPLKLVLSNFVNNYLKEFS